MVMTPMNSTSLSADDLLAWNDAHATAWAHVLSTHPALLLAPCDIYGSTTNIGQLLQHIVAVELRYAERLSSTPATDYSSIPYGSPEEIFATHVRAFTMFRDLLANPDFDWDEELEFSTLTAGRRRASRKAIFHHALLHGIRHYAQLATHIRHMGYKPPDMDYLLMTARRVG